MPNADMQFSADATPAIAQISKLVEQNKLLTASLEAAAKAALKGADIAVQAYNQQNSETKKLIDQNKKLKEQLDDVKNGMKKTGDDGSMAFAGIGTSIVNKVLGGLRQAIDMQVQYNRELANMSLERDKVDKKAQIQAQISDEDWDKYYRNIAESAKKAGVTITDATQAAAELYQQGFEKEDAYGGKALDVALQTAKGTRADDVIGVIQATAMSLNTQDKKLDAENFYKEMASNTQLYANTPFQTAHMIDLVKEGGTFKEAGVDMNTAKAGLVVLEKFGKKPEMAPTNMRNIVSVLGEAPENDQTKQLLEEITGSKEGAAQLMEKISLSKNTLPQALANLSNAMGDAGWNKDEQFAQMSKMFGREGASGALTLMGQRGKWREFIDMQNSDESLRKGIAISQEGQAYKANQIAVETEVKRRNAARKEERFQQ